MKNIYKIIIIIVILAIAIVGIFAVLGNHNSNAGDGPSYNASALNEKLSIDMNNWSYDETNDIYYQIGLVYCMNPENTSYESCGIYVPGKYFEAEKTQTEHTHAN